MTEMRLHSTEVFDMLSGIFGASSKCATALETLAETAIALTAENFKETQ
jgi:hypothetical protein